MSVNVNGFRQHCLRVTSDFTLDGGVMAGKNYVYAVDSPCDRGSMVALR